MITEILQRWLISLCHLLRFPIPGQNPPQDRPKPTSAHRSPPFHPSLSAGAGSPKRGSSPRPRTPPLPPWQEIRSRRRESTQDCPRLPLRCTVCHKALPLPPLAASPQNETAAP